MTVADHIVKALQDLHHSIQKTRNNKGEINFEALKSIDKMFNNQPQAKEQPDQSNKKKKVRFETKRSSVVKYHPDPRVAME